MSFHSVFISLLERKLKGQREIMNLFTCIIPLLLAISTSLADRHSLKNEMYRGFHHYDSDSSSSEESNYQYKGGKTNYTHGITLECDYAIMKHYWGEMYTCVVRNLHVPHHYDHVVNVTGDHLTGKGIKDVQAVYVLGQRTPFIPYNISGVFGGSVTALRIEGSGLRYINRTLAVEGNLQYLHLENNLIEEVPRRSFTNLTDLRWISFRNNRIRYIDSGILHGMKKLWRFSASNNLIEVVPTGLFHDTSAIREIYFYNNRIRMVGWRMVNWTPNLKVAAFYGNGCTDISIYDGADIRGRLTKEFQSKCSVDCRHAGIGLQKEKGELEFELRKLGMCAYRGNDGDNMPRRQFSSSSSSGEN